MKRQGGAVTVEFALVGIPLIFALISTIEMSRGMWIYHTETFAISEGARFIVVHGDDCAQHGNTCTTTVGGIANTIASSGVGLLPSRWNVTLHSASGTNDKACTPLTNCLNDNTVWPPSPDNTLGTSVAISASYPFSSAMSMFFPGSSPVNFGTYNLPAYSSQVIMF